MELIAKFSQLHPRTFENLVYDLLTQRGLANARWRTPGVDGGRDIEGIKVVADFSGAFRTERWYIECKRYQQSIDWPTVFSKLAFAENHQADFLLFCTTSTLSPKCRDEIAIREGRNLRPAIRAWEGHDLSTLVSSDPALMQKYGLSTESSESGLAVLPLLWGATKSIHDAYGNSLGRMADDKQLELAAALSELAVVSVERAKNKYVSPHPFLDGRDLYKWCDISGAPHLTGFDSYGLRAALCVIRVFGRHDRLTIEPGTTDDATMASTIEISPASNLTESSFAQLMKTVSTIADLEWLLDETTLLLSQRRPRDA